MALSPDIQRMIVQFKERQAIMAQILEIVDSVPKLDHYEKLTGDYVVTHDWHSPFFSGKWVQRLFHVSWLYGIRRHICAGDMFDLTNFSEFAKSTYNEKDAEWELGRAGKSVSLILDGFDENILLSGNHDRRMLKMVFQFGANIKFKTSLAMILQEQKQNLLISDYPYCILNGKKAIINGKQEYVDGWLICHPKNYSVITARVPTALAGKFEMNVLSAHGHHMGWVYSDNGRYICIDGGGMMDLTKTDYVMKSITKHPRWQNGFTIIKNNHAHIFHERMDWQKIMAAETLGEMV